MTVIRLLAQVQNESRIVSIAMAARILALSKRVEALEAMVDPQKSQKAFEFVLAEVDRKYDQIQTVVEDFRRLLARAEKSIGSITQAKESSPTGNCFINGEPSLSQSIIPICMERMCDEPSEVWCVECHDPLCHEHVIWINTWEGTPVPYCGACLTAMMNSYKNDKSIQREGKGIQREGKGIAMMMISDATSVCILLRVAGLLPA